MESEDHTAHDKTGENMFVAKYIQVSKQKEGMKDHDLFLS